jgi:hypothetical protein
MENLYFILGIGIVVYLSYQLGKDRGTLLASERVVDIMIAMGYLKENVKGEIEKIDHEQSK